jgi:hypothetical protein
MASVINIDTSGFEDDMNKIADALADKELLLRPVCVELSGIMNDRIHNKGEASDGSQIGTYSSSYLKYRKKFNHQITEKKVILVLTRKLSNSWGAFATEKGYGVGFTDSGATEGVTALDKIRFNEQNFQGKKIGDLTTEENQYAIDRLNELTNSIINGRG